MKEALVFNGPNALDFYDIRSNVVRIPEVSARIREAQNIWERFEENSFNFGNFLASEDATFLSNIKLKTLAAAVVQVGLWDRYIKKFGAPEFYIGNVNGDSALQVASGQMTLGEMVAQSKALKIMRPMAPLSVAEEPLLTGMSLTEFAVYQRITVDDGSTVYERVNADAMDINKVIRNLVDDFGVKRFINIGPGNSLLVQATHDFALSEIEIVESIDLDPMLNWFWPGMGRSESTISAH